MPRDVQYSAAVSKIDECIESCSDELIDTSVEGGEKVGWQVKRGDYTYTITRIRDSDHFQVSFEYTIIGTVASVLSVEDADMILREEGIQVDDEQGEERRLTAADVLLSKTPENIRVQFTNDLIQLMSHPRLSFDFMHTDNGSVAAFRLNKNLFPYSNDFRLKEFDEAVQTVITVGHSASTYTQISLDVQSVVDEHVSKPSLPYVQ